MSQHHYEITVQETVGPKGTPATHAEPIRFEVDSHDDLHEIVWRIQSLGKLEGEAAVAFAIGLKLFGNVMLTHRTDPLFAEFAPHFGQFMRTLKGQAAPGGGRHLG